MKQIDKQQLKKYCIQLAPHVIFAYLGDKLAWLYRLSPGDQMLQKLMLQQVLQKTLEIKFLISLFLGVL